MRPSAYIFSMKQCLVVPYINPASQAPVVQTGHAPRVIISHRLIMEKLKIFSETMRPTAYIFSM